MAHSVTSPTLRASPTTNARIIAAGAGCAASVCFVTGRIDARRDLPEALKIAASGAFALAPIATTVVAWNDAPAAWCEPATKLVIRR